MTVLGDRIWKARKRRRLSREQLAAAAGCSYFTLARIERPGSTYDPKLSTLRRIADGLHVALSELLE